MGNFIAFEIKKQKPYTQLSGVTYGNRCIRIYFVVYSIVKNFLKSSFFKP